MRSAAAMAEGMYSTRVGGTVVVCVAGIVSVHQMGLEGRGSLKRSGVEDAVAEGAEGESRVVVGLGAVDEVDFEEDDTAPGRC